MGRPRKKPTLFEQLTSGGERRLFERKILKSNVIFEDEFGEPLLRLESVNVSLGGLLLKEAVPMRYGSRTFLSFRLPTATMPIRLVGEIVRAGEDGVGVRFVEVPPDVRLALEQWLREPL